MFAKPQGRNNINHTWDAQAKHTLILELIDTKWNNQSDAFYTDKISSKAVTMTPIRSGGEVGGGCLIYEKHRLKCMTFLVIFLRPSV